MGPKKLPLKIVPLGTPYWPKPVAIKLEPSPEKVPPVEILPVRRAPVAKLTHPRSCPGGDFFHSRLKAVSSDRFDTIPASPIVTEPNWFTRKMSFPHAAT